MQPMERLLIQKAPMLESNIKGVAIVASGMKDFTETKFVLLSV